MSFHVKWTCSQCGKTFYVPHFVSEPNRHFCGCETPTPVKRPPVRKMAWSLAKSIAAFVADPRFVDQDEYKKRLSICDGCPSRIESRCGECGCYVAVKARGKVFECPLGKWSGTARRPENRDPDRDRQQSVEP